MRRNVRTRTRIVAWLLFGVGFGLLPLLVRFILLVMSQTGVSVSLLLGDGELLIAFAAISGSALGELFSSRRRNDVSEPLQMTVMFFALIACLSCAVAYGQARSTPLDILIPVSMVLSLSALLAASACIILAVKR